MNVDYIIVGSGLAGIAFAEKALQNNKSVFVFDNNSQTSTKIAAGIFNPIILKRFTIVANAAEQLSKMYFFYENLEKKWQTKLLFKNTVLRKFSSIEDQNNWFTALDKIKISNYLSNQLIKNSNPNIVAKYHFGQVLATGFVDTALMVVKFQEYLLNKNLFYNEIFDYESLIINAKNVVYKNIVAKNIVFAEGFGLHANPFFNDLPLDGTKGEVLIIKSVDLQLENIVNSSLYIVPLGNNLYKVGATYNWENKDSNITEEGYNELVLKLKEIINCDFEIVNQQAGVRPTVRDRKPLLGKHKSHNNLFVFNGLGTRGVMLAPYLADKLFNHIEYNEPLEKDISIYRLKNYK